jgi:cytochrome c oxidase subunit 2
VVLAGALLAGVLLAACGDDDAADPPVTSELSTAAREGAELARTKGCVACHSSDGGRSTGPTWAGLAGSEVELEGGVTVTADRAYLERSIVDPRSQVRAGYADIMPTTYRLTDAEVGSLLAFLEEIGAD